MLKTDLRGENGDGEESLMDVPGQAEPEKWDYFKKIHSTSFLFTNLESRSVIPRIFPTFNKFGCIFFCTPSKTTAITNLLSEMSAWERRWPKSGSRTTCCRTATFFNILLEFHLLFVQRRLFSTEKLRFILIFAKKKRQTLSISTGSLNPKP